jgi:uncharacterized membrane protein YedE/YeeE
MSFLPAWIVAPALAALTVGYWIVLRRPLGVSGVLARFSRVREEAEFDRGAAVLQAEQAALEAAMTAMTAEAFGGSAMDLAATGTDGPAAVAMPGQTEWPAPAPAPAEPEGRACAPTPTLGVHATFLVSLAVGGLLVALFRGRFGAGMGAAFAARFASPAAQVAALAGGGVLVGFGTALCGGCSSGHGLTGCGRLMPGSLVATATFFGAAVAVSLLLGRLA